MRTHQQKKFRNQTQVMTMHEQKTNKEGKPRQLDCDQSLYHPYSSHVTSNYE